MAGGHFRMSVDQAIMTLKAAGAVFVLPDSGGKGSLSLAKAAARLDVSRDWVRDHLHEFPGAWRLPAGSAGERCVGELRIPVRDLERFEERRRLPVVA
jgi:hypothetical protein